MGAGITYLASSGRSEIDKVLTTVTGRNYTNLKNLLVLAGKDSTVQMDSRLGIGELYGGYGFLFNTNWLLDLTFGVAKVFSAEVRLNSGLASFEDSPLGGALMRNSEGDLEQIILDYGIAPRVGVKVQYLF